VGKKKKGKRVTISHEHYAALLARGGMASLEVLMRFEDAVNADPAQWAEPHGATKEQMLAGVALLRQQIMAEVLNTSVAATTGV
jgi:hypothetical protein